MIQIELSPYSTIITNYQLDSPLAFPLLEVANSLLPKISIIHQKDQDLN